MDEILRPTPQALPKEPRETLAGRLEALRRRWPLALNRWDEFRARHRLRAIPFLLCAVAAGAALTVNTVYTTGCAVSVNGQELGVAAQQSEFEAVVERVEARASEILGYDYTLTAQVTYEPRVVEKSELTDLSGFEPYLFNQVGEVMKTHVLTIGGEVIGATTHGGEVEAILEGLKAPYMTDNTVSADFTVPVELRYEYTATAELMDTTDFRRILTANSLEEVTYTVVAGDTYSEIAYDRDMSLDELMAMNPQASLDSLYVGDVLTVQQSVPFLSVRTVDKEVYEEPIEAPVEYVQDDSMYEGDSKVLEEGAAGSALVHATVTKVNGMEQARDITSSQTLVEPVTRVVAQGTKERPRTMATGHFIWPVYGHITSRYGYRSIFGSYSYHGGLDIAVPYGTSVKAADGGRVITSGWNNSYGNYIIIDHENGKTTYYAHNSKLLVGVGERVYQGQVIAKAGSTGRSTGSHCHFEVRINGQRQNPRNYLP